MDVENIRGKMVSVNNNLNFIHSGFLSGGGAGVNIGSNGLSPYFSVYGMKGKGNGTSVSYTGTEFKAENKITAVTGDGDFILDGSTIKANKGGKK